MTKAEQLAILARIYNLLSGSVSPEDAQTARELTYELIRSVTAEMESVDIPTMSPIGKATQIVSCLYIDGPTVTVEFPITVETFAFIRTLKSTNTRNVILTIPEPKP